MVKVYRTLIFCVFISIVYQTSQAQKLYFSDGGAVKRMNLDATGVETIIPQGPYDWNYIAVDGDNNLLFYNDGQQTYRAFLDGSSPTLVTDDGAFAGYSNLAVIPDYESVIYAGISDDMNDLWRGDYYNDPSTPPTVLNTGITMSGDEEYLDIAYNPSEEKIYVTGYDGAVYSCFQDGTGAALIVSSANAVGPIGVDYVNAKVYWVQYTAGAYSIMRANLNGSGVTTILANGSASIESLDVYPEQNAVFFAQTNGIYRTPLDGVGGKTLLFAGTYIRNVAIDFDITPPAFFTLNPTNGATNVATTANLSLTFNENVKLSEATPGTTDDFSFRIYESSVDELVETIDRGSSNITIAGNIVTLNPTTILEYNTDYYVFAGNKTISDFSDNNWIGITLSTGWTFKTEPDPSVFYSRQNGNWNSPSTWSHVSHTGPAATNTPGTGSDVIIGNGNTVTLAGNTSVVGSTATGTWITSGATLDAASYDFTVWGTLRIDGQLLNGGLLTGTFDLYATGGIPVFDEIHYGVSGFAGAESNIYTHAVALNGIQAIDGGTINTNGFQICVPPTPSPTVPLFSNITSNSITLSWTVGGGDAFVVARAYGSTPFKPAFGQAYAANAEFGSGDEVGTGNYLVYKGTGNTVTITGLTPGTEYEFDLYSYSTSIGGCYSIQNYQFAYATSCIVLPAPSGAVNAQYCTGDTKPSLNVNSPGAGQRIRWYDAPSGGNLVAGNDTGGDGLGEVFVPNAPSGTFYAETFDEELLCTSTTRTAVTLTLHPTLVAGIPSADQNICSGGDPAVMDGGTASGGTGAYTYQWESALASAGPYTMISSATDPTYDPPAGLTQTTYYHRIIRSATCLQTGNPVTVTVITTPAITVQPTSAEVCEGESASFTIDATGTTIAYQWQTDTGPGFADISNGGVYAGATTNQLLISDASGLNNRRYQCIVTSAGTCPVTSTAVPLVVNTRPVVVNQTLDVCETVAGSGIATVDLTALNSAITGGAALTVDWFTNPDLTTPVVSPANASANNNTVFYARVSNNSTSCYSPATAAITVNVKPSGTGTIAGALSLCTNNPSTYTISGISDALRYNWQGSVGLEILSQNGASASIQSVSGTSGTITVTSENGCGSGSTASLEVQILTSPEVQIITPSEVITGEVADFSFESASAIQAIQWDFGDNATSTELAPQHQYITDGNYPVVLTVLDDASCETTESITLVVLPLPELSDTNIKNVITANGDSQNGFLYIENIEKHPSNQVVLLDRWGVEVFKKDNYVNDWDARRNGEFLPAGQYVCVVKLNETGKIFTRTVSIIKRK